MSESIPDTPSTGTAVTTSTPSSSKVSRFNTQPRDMSTALALGSTIDRKQRPSLTPEERRKLYTTATTAMSPKFKTFEDTLDIKSETFLEANHDFFIVLQTLRKHLKAYCMDDVFQIITMFDASGTPNDSDPTSLIDYISDYLTVNEAQILKSNHAYRFYGDETALENLNWTADFLLNSCDETLHDTVANKIFATPEEYQGGPLVLYHIIQATVKTTEGTTRAIIRKLENFKLSKVSNEDIHKANAFMRSAIIRLKAADRLPTDVHKMVYDVYLTCSVFAFRDHFTTLKTVQSSIINDWDTLLKEGETLYRELEFEDRWITRHKRGSNFHAAGASKPSRTTRTANTVSSNTDKTFDKAGRIIDRNPPHSGEPTTRTKDGKTESWCGNPKCNRWGNHSTENHETWYQEMKTKWSKLKEKKKSTAKQDNSTAKTNNDRSSTEPKRLRFAQNSASQANF